MKDSPLLGPNGPAANRRPTSPRIASLAVAPVLLQLRHTTRRPYQRSVPNLGSWCDLGVANRLSYRTISSTATSFIYDPHQNLRLRILTVAKSFQLTEAAVTVHISKPACGLPAVHPSVFPRDRASLYKCLWIRLV